MLSDLSVQPAKKYRHARRINAWRTAACREMAEPDGEGVLKQGEAVLLVSLEGNTFKAILNPSGSLVD